MKLASAERLAYIAGLAIAVAAAIGALLVGGDLEVTLFMVAAVAAGLLCFDISMERRLASFGPWVWLSVAPAMKTVPSVWFQLRPDGTALFERYDHAGSLLFGCCVFIAVALLTRPSRRLGRGVAVFGIALIVGTAATAAAAGASVAFRRDLNFGSATAGRILETPTWFVIGGLLAAIVLAMSLTQRPTWSLVGVLATASGSAALLAVTVAGRNPDRGWWAILFVGLAASAVSLGPASLGTRSARTRVSNAGAVAAILAGTVAAAAAIAARSDRLSWQPGWMVLGVLAVAMCALALVSKAPGEAAAELTGRESKQAERDKERALRTLGSASRAEHSWDSVEPGAEVPAQQRTQLEPSMAEQAAIAAQAVEPEPVVAAQPVRAAAPVEPEPVVAAQPVRAAAPVEPEPVVAAQPVRAAAPVEPEPVVAAQPVRAAPPVQAEPMVAAAAPVQAEPSTHPEPRPAHVAAAQTTQVSGTEAVARAAAALAAEPASPQRHSLTPLEHAHHFDPSTGLLSATGLQHFITRAFQGPRSANAITIMLFTIRDFDDIERNHGRLASAAVTREIAERIRSLMPNGTGARFGRAAYAVLFVGDTGESVATVQRLARVLLELRAPVEGGSLGANTDVVAGMAQCYETEDAAQFITRANTGLARAVRTVEPTLVAMP